MEKSSNIYLYLIELARDLFFCGVLIAAGSEVTDRSFFDGFVWLNLFAGWFIIVAGLISAVVVVAVAMQKVSGLLTGWEKFFAMGGAGFIAMGGFAAFAAILNML